MRIAASNGTSKKNRLKLWAATAGAGFALIAASVFMAFLSSYHSYVGYERSLRLEAWEWRVQAAGIVSFVVGGIGLLASLAPGATLRTGVVLIGTGVIVCLVFGTFILEVHDWGIVLIFPVLLILLGGSVFVIVGIVRDRQAIRR